MFWALILLVLLVRIEIRFFLSPESATLETWGIFRSFILNRFSYIPPYCTYIYPFLLLTFLLKYIIYCVCQKYDGRMVWQRIEIDVTVKTLLSSNKGFHRCVNGILKTKHWVSVNCRIAYIHKYRIGNLIYYTNGWNTYLGSVMFS